MDLLKIRMTNPVLVTVHSGKSVMALPMVVGSSWASTLAFSYRFFIDLLALTET